MIHGAHRLASLASIVLLASVAHGQSLAALVAKAEKQGLRTGVVVGDLRTGRIVYRHRAHEAFIPASNQKLVTVAAALWGLGRDYQFTTTFTLRRGVLEVHAGGDPNWSVGSAHDPAAIFKSVAAALRAGGAERIRGVKLVPGLFTGPIRPAHWPRDQFDKRYCAPTGGLVLEAGCFVGRISPGAGGRARVELLAPPLATVFRGAIKMTTKRKKRYSYWLSQRGDGFTAHGEFSARARPIEVRGVSQRPDWVFAESLRTVLRREGVVIDAAADPRDLPAIVRKSALLDAVLPILKESSNFHAEQVLRVVGSVCGGDGSFAGGTAAVRKLVAGKLEIPAAVEIADGSGLSRTNRLTPAFVVDLLRVLFRGEHTRLLAANLARGGVDGTLRRRFRGHSAIGRAVCAKTGTIRGVKCLSGLVRQADGGLRLFSILMNRDKGGSIRGAANLQDAMVMAIYHGQ